MNRNIRRLGIALMVSFAALFVQLNYVQVVQAHKLANAPGNSRLITQQFSRPRGVIQTADGIVIARSQPSNDDLKFLRQYPEGPLYSQITGYDSFIYGTDGVEQTYNNLLTGKNLPIRHLSDLLTSRQTTGNLTLTISDVLQHAAQSALGTKKGSVVVLNPTTGAVLAMYSNPGYDPTPLASHDTNIERTAWGLYQLDPNQPMLARAYRRDYFPGSTFKIITSAAVFDHNPPLATKNYPVVSQINLPLATQPLHNFASESCGGTLPDLLKVSCNTGFAQVGLDLGAPSLAAEAQAFGFDQLPPIDLPRPASSAFPPVGFYKNNTPQLAFSAIGQGNVAATTLQMALVGAAIANGGMIMTPHVLGSVRDNQGNILSTYSPKPWLQATSASTADQVRTLMEGVVQPGGTAPDLNLPNVVVAAKTGTAQTGTNLTNDWMVAFAPANGAKIVVAVTVPNQPASATGDSVSGPIAKALLLAALGLPQ
jgi:peptidoglycan glycosyltransferase